MPDLLGQEKITRILNDIQNGHPSSAEQLLPLVYEELRALADSFFRHERTNHTLQPTALVHEAYLRLVNQQDLPWQSRAHFFGAAAQAMRRVLINYAESYNALKRGGDRHRVTLSDQTPDPGVEVFGDIDLLALNEAMLRLERLDERQCRVIELRYFAGLSVEQTADVLAISPRLVKLDWQMARAWLYTQLHG